MVMCAVVVRAVVLAVASVRLLWRLAVLVCLMVALFAFALIVHVVPPWGVGQRAALAKQAVFSMGCVSLVRVVCPRVGHLSIISVQFHQAVHTKGAFFRASSDELLRLTRTTHACSARVFLPLLHDGVGRAGTYACERHTHSLHHPR